MDKANKLLKEISEKLGTNEEKEKESGLHKK